MKRAHLLFTILLLSLLGCSQKSTNQRLPSLHSESNNVSFETENGVKIYGDLIIQDKGSTTILLFHQGGSNARGEYSPIVTRLIEKGFNILAVDLRQGGQVFGNYNRTVAGLAESFSYCEAYEDLEATLKFAIDQGFSGNVFLWGSSYSGSLAVKLGSEYGDQVSGVLAFSPASGGPMAECKADLYLDNLDIPLLLLRPSNELEIESSRTQFVLAQDKGFHVYEAKNGVHGSSMLVQERVGENVDEHWEAVFKFIEFQF